MGKKLTKIKPIVVLGGMGPQASCYMLRILIDLATSKFGATEGHTFPHIIMESIPVPVFFSSEKNKKLGLKILKDEITELNKRDILCLSMACNTAHMLLPELKILAKAPFVSMITESVKLIRKKGIKTIGLLASPMTVKSRLYQNECLRQGIKIILPKQKQLQNIGVTIGKIMAGKIAAVEKNIVTKIADKLILKGAEGILLGCTELPLIFPERYKKPIFNSVEILSIALLKKYYQKN